MALLQVIVANLMNFIMLGLVFARFSAPFKRATTIAFSKVCTISRHSSGFWALTFRCEEWIGWCSSRLKM